MASNLNCKIGVISPIFADRIVLPRALPRSLGKNLKAGGEGTAEDEVVGWHHGLSADRSLR